MLPISWIFLPPSVLFFPICRNREERERDFPVVLQGLGTPLCFVLGFYRRVRCERLQRPLPWPRDPRTVPALRGKPERGRPGGIQRRKRADPSRPAGAFPSRTRGQPVRPGDPQRDGGGFAKCQGTERGASVASLHGVGHEETDHNEEEEKKKFTLRSILSMLVSL